VLAAVVNATSRAESLFICLSKVRIVLKVAKILSNVARVYVS
jgi:hypothetical protein